MSVEAVVRAALGALDEGGLEAVSMRSIADRLDVRMNTVLWHTKSKARLHELMADAILAEMDSGELPDAWDDRVREVAHRARRAMLAHRDGARLVTGTYAAEPATLRFADQLVQALLDGGVPEREAAWACWTFVYFLLGLVQEEQAFHEQAGRLDPELPVAAYPALTRVVEHLTADAAGYEERFDFGLSLLLDSLRARAGEGRAH